MLPASRCRRGLLQGFQRNARKVLWGGAEPGILLPGDHLPRAIIRRRQVLQLRLPVPVCARDEICSVVCKLPSMCHNEPLLPRIVTHPHLIGRCFVLLWTQLLHWTECKQHLWWRRTPLHPPHAVRGSPSLRGGPGATDHETPLFAISAGEEMRGGCGSCWLGHILAWPARSGDCVAMTLCGV